MNLSPESCLIATNVLFENLDMRKIVLDSSISKCPSPAAFLDSVVLFVQQGVLSSPQGDFHSDQRKLAFSMYEHQEARKLLLL